MFRRLPAPAVLPTHTPAPAPASDPASAPAERRQGIELNPLRVGRPRDTSAANIRPQRNARMIEPAVIARPGDYRLGEGLKHGLAPLAVAAAQLGSIALLVYLFNQAFKQAAPTSDATTRSTSTTYAPGATEPSSITHTETTGPNSALSTVTKADNAHLFALGYSMYVVMTKTEAAIIGATLGGRLSPAGALAANHRASKQLVEPWLDQEAPDMRSVVRTIDRMLDSIFASVPLVMGPDVANRDNGVIEATNRAELLLHFRNDILLNRPFAKKEVEAMKTAAGRAELRQRIDDRIALYPDKLKIFVRNELMTLAWRSLEIEPERDAQGREIEPDEQKHVAEFRGKSGSGKSHLIKIAEEELGLVRIPMEYPDDENEGMSGMYARPWSALLSSEPTNDHALLGAVLEAMFEARCANPLLDFAEVDYSRKNVRNTKKRLEDPAEKTMHIRTLNNVGFRVSGLNFVSTTNDDEIEPANRDRLHKFAVFDEVSDASREASARKSFDLVIRMFAGERKDGSAPALDAAQAALAKDSFDAVLPDLLAAAKQADASSRLLFAQDLSVYIADRVDAGRPPTRKHLRAYISDYFAERPPGASVDERERGQPVNAPAEAGPSRPRG